MTDLAHDEPTLPQPPGTRLTGWKEIAAYLDRGVRTAQRWEREFGLPVRRMGGALATGGRAESVFAFTEEIEEWLASSSAAQAKGLNDTAAAKSESGEQTPPGEGAEPEGHAPPLDVPVGAISSESHTAKRLIPWMLAAAVVVLGAIGVWREWSIRNASPEAPATSGPLGEPSEWHQEADTLVVLDAAGNHLWSRRFPRTAPVTSLWPGNGTLGGIQDLDQDGVREVWFVRQPADASTRSALTLFDHEGNERWSFAHSGAVRFGAVTYAGAWAIHWVFVTEAPEDASRQALWISSRDTSDYPSVLQRIDIRTGTPIGGPYWSNGWINSVAIMRTKDGPRLVVGATNNEHRSPSVAVLNALDITGSAPATTDKYRCMDCPAGSPVAFALLPRPKRFRPEPGSGTAVIAQATTDTVPIVVTAVYAAVAADQPAATAVIHLDATLRPLYADVSDTYAVAYDMAVRAGSIPDVGPVPRDSSRELLPISLWRKGRFIPVDVDRSLPTAASSAIARSRVSARPVPKPASEEHRSRTPRSLRP